MEKNRIIIFVLGFVLIIGGLSGAYINNDFNDDSRFRINSNDMIKGNQWRNDSNYSRIDTSSRINVDKNSKVIELDELKSRVELYLNNYEEKLGISDIFIFEDSEYYFSIIEEDTGRGAMELLVNQYTGDVFPEFGPNMMWNLKYGMHNSNMMSGRGMMSYNSTNYSEFNDINMEEAYDYGKKYLVKYSDNFNLADEFHEFYGYYTFHVEENGNTVGMLSVDGATGEVWFHEWHGMLREVISDYDNH
jgi:hypothetical protein